MFPAVTGIVIHARRDKIKRVIRDDSMMVEAGVGGGESYVFVCLRL